MIRKRECQKRQWTPLKGEENRFAQVKDRIRVEMESTQS